MAQVLPRYCLRCSSPIRADMQRCATCDLPIETMLHHPDNRQSETGEYNNAILQQGDDELLPDGQPGWDTRGEPAPPPRFPPASPLPPELGKWIEANNQDVQLSPLSLEADKWSELNNQDAQPSPLPLEPEDWSDPDNQDAQASPLSLEAGERDEPDNQGMQASPLPPEPEEWSELNNQDMQQPGFAQQEPRFAQTQPPISEPWNGPDLAYSPDSPAILSVEATPTHPDNSQLEIEEYNDAALPEAIISSRRCLRQEDDESLSTLSEVQDRQPGGNLPGESPQPSPFPPTSLFPPEPDERKAPGGRRRAGIVFIVLAALVIVASGGYRVFSGHWPIKSTRTNSAVDVPAAATAKAANTNPYATGGTLIFSDTLNAANSNWDQNVGCAFKGDSYQVTATTIQSCTLNANVTLTNFVLEVKVTLLHGDLGGFFFRENKLGNRSNAYLLDFDSKGNYQLWNYTVSSAAKSIDHGFSGGLNTGYNQTNTIALVVQGQSITLYANGHRIRQFIDSTHSSGGLSLISSEYAHHTGTAKAAYSDLRLWRL